MKRKIFVILLLFSFIAPVVTTYVILRYQKKQVKKEVKKKIISGIDKEELVLLKFTEGEIKSQLEWEHSKEFQYKGEMYDVVEKEVRGDTTFFWCWWDSEETDLNKQLKGLVKRILEKNPKNQENQKRLNNFLNSLFIKEPICKITITIQKTKNKPFYKQKFRQSIINSPLVPPPEIV